MTFASEYIWIIGASSGIGEALSRELAKQGATLILSARREAELLALNEALGGTHHVLPLDVSDGDAVQAAAEHIQATVPTLQRVVFMAAIYRPHDIAERDVAFTKQLVEVNLLGALYTTYAVLPLFEKQGEGQIALCGSVAGYTGLPGGQPYSATKAAIINFAESLRAEIDDSIDVKVINPGFVRTRITDKNRFRMPMRIEPGQAARAIASGLQKNAFEIHFPKGFTYVVKLFGVLPYWLKVPLNRLLRGRS